MRPIKRIQHNVRPSDGCNDSSAMIPTGPEQSASAPNAVRSSDTNIKGSTVSPREPERSVSSANTVVQRCGSKIDAVHRRIYMERESLTPENVHNADSVS